MRDIEVKKQTQFNEIQNSRYGKRYKELQLLGVSEYLRNQRKKDQMIIARFRCGTKELCSSLLAETGRQSS